MRIKPILDHILIEPIKENEKTKSGILLPETTDKEKPEQGKVIAVGPGKRTEDGKMLPMSVTPGQKVLFTKYGPNEIKVEGKEYDTTISSFTTQVEGDHNVYQEIVAQSIKLIQDFFKGGNLKI